MFGNPLCGYPLRKGSQIIAVIDLIIAIPISASLLYTLISHYSGEKTQSPLLIIIRLLVYTILEVCLFQLLYKAAKLRVVGYCQTWCSLRFLFLVIKCAIFIYDATVGNLQIVEIVLACMFIIYRTFEIVVVNEFKDEILAFARQHEETLQEVGGSDTGTQIDGQ